MRDAAMPKLVDVIFLDIDGVLLPFGGGARIGDRQQHSELTRHTEGCIFPDRTMEALTTLLTRLNASGEEATNDDASSSSSSYRAKLVLSSTWRARPEFVEDILSSFRAYAIARGREDATVLRVWKSHSDSFFDVTDPNYHATRHEEILNWVRTKANNAREEYIVRSWIALDDEDLVNVEGRVLPEAIKHAVKTKSSVGLTLTEVCLGVRLIETQIREFHLMKRKI